MLLDRLLDKMIKVGSLAIIDTSGKTRSFKGAKEGPSVASPPGPVGDAAHPDGNIGRIH